MDNGGHDADSSRKTTLAITAVGILLGSGLVGLYFAVATKRVSSDPAPGPSEKCTGVYCNLTEQLKAYRNPQTKPCDNFYAHQCGQFAAKNALTGADDVELSQLTIHVNKTKATLISYLLPKDGGRGEKQNLPIFDRVYRRFFQLCMSKESKSDKSKDTEAIHNIFSGMDLMNTTSIVAEALRFGLPNLFEFEPARRPADESANAADSILLVKVNKFWRKGAGRGGDFFNDLEKPYFKEVFKLAKTILGPDAQSMKLKVSKLLKDLSELKKLGPADDETRRRYKVSKRADLGRVLRGPGDIGSLGENERQTIGIDFRAVLNELNYGSAVMIEDEKEFNVTVTAPITAGDLLAAIKLNTVMHFGPYIQPSLLDDEVAHAKLPGVEIYDLGYRSRSDWCFNKITEYAPHALAVIMSRYGKYDVKIIQEIFDDLKETLHPVLKEAGDRIPQYLVDKLEKMKVLIGSPGLSDAKLEQTLPKIKGKDTAELLEMSLIDLAKHLSASKWENVKRPTQLSGTGDDVTWVSSPLSPLSHYSYVMNTIELAPASLQGLFFNPGFHKAWNIPTLGFIIARLMMHAFDPKGRHLDASGVVDKHFTHTKTRELDKKLEQAYRDHRPILGQKKDPFKKYDGNYLVENIADFEGLHLAFQTFKSKYLAARNAMAKSIDTTVTNEQLFFSIFANSLCENVDYRLREYRIKQGLFAEALFRVNVPCSHSLAFSRTFECSKNSTGEIGPMGIREDQIMQYNSWEQ